MNSQQLEINVTAEDIRNGEAVDCEKCAVGLAAARATGSRCGVGTSNIVSDFLGGSEAILPEEARKFIRTFDSGGDARPFSFSVVFEKRKTYR